MSLLVDCGAGHRWDVIAQDRCPQCPRGAPELNAPPRSWQWAPPPPVLGRCAQCGRACPLDRRCTHGAGTPPAHRWSDSESLVASAAVPVAEEVVPGPSRRDDGGTATPSSEVSWASREESSLVSELLATLAPEDEMPGIGKIAARYGIGKGPAKRVQDAARDARARTGQ